MLPSLSPFESSREQHPTDDRQWIIDFYIPNLRRPGRRRYGGEATDGDDDESSTSSGTGITNPDDGSFITNPDTGETILNPDA